MVVFATKVLGKLVLSMFWWFVRYWFTILQAIFSLSKQKTDETPDDIAQKQSHY